jgi:hypothetical protein
MIARACDLAEVGSELALELALPREIVDRLRELGAAAWREESGMLIEIDAELLVSGYWEYREGEPFFDRELERALGELLGGKVSVLACPPGSECIVYKDGAAHFDFEVWHDGKLVARGTAHGHCAVHREGPRDGTWVDCAINHVYLSVPHSR